MNIYFRKSQLRGLTAATLLLLAAPLVGTTAVANASTPEEAVIAVLSDNPADSTDALGDSVSVVQELGDVGESLAYVETDDGTPALVTTQYGAPAQQPQGLGPDAEFPEDVNEPEGQIVDGNLLISGGFDSDEIAQVSNNDLELNFVSAVTDTTVSFSWLPDPSVESYTVLRDGEIITETSTTSFLESGLKADSDYEYEIVNGSAQSTEPVTSKYVPIATLTGNAKASAKIADGAVALTYQEFNTAFIYKTFITNTTVTADLLTSLGCSVNPGQKLKGDNRGFQSPGSGAPGTTPSYRTMMFFNVNWGNDSPYDLVWTKGVGQTAKLNSAGVLMETRYANTAKMVFQNPSRSGNYAQVGMSHEVTDPFCAALSAVRYSLTNVQLYRSGTVTVTGSRMPTPAHEAYARFTNSSGTEVWRTLYQGAQGPLTCTLPSACASQNINKSVSY